MKRGSTWTEYGEKHEPTVSTFKNGAVCVYVDRSARLSDRLEEVEDRRVMGITVVIGDGGENPVELTFQTRRDVERFRDALVSAIDSTELVWRWSADAGHDL